MSDTDGDYILAYGTTETGDHIPILVDDDGNIIAQEE